MQNTIIKAYYQSEQRLIGTTLLWGIFSTIGSLAILMSNVEPLWQGLGFGLLSLGLLIWGKTTPRLIHCSQQLKTTTTDTAHILATTEQYLQTLGQYRFVTQILLLLGFALMLIGAFAKLGNLLTGSGIGVLIQSAFTLVLSLIAQWRASLFQSELRINKNKT